PSKIPRGKKAKGKKVAPAPTIVKKQEAKNIVNPLVEKMSKNLALSRTSRNKETSPTSSNVHPGPGPETATQLLTLAHKYRPETMQEKKLRLLDRARKKAGDKGDVPITTLVETKKAQLAVITHDVDPTELVVFLSALCQKTGVPY
ncbi:hypothetical protein U0070_022685, partial [Myodes glareolus]